MLRFASLGRHIDAARQFALQALFAAWNHAAKLKITVAHMPFPGGNKEFAWSDPTIPEEPST